MGFKVGMFFLLLSIQLHLLLALHPTSLPSPLLSIDLKQEQNVTYDSFSQRLSTTSAKLGDKQNITAVNKRGSGAGGHGGRHGRRRGHGGRGGAGNRGDSGVRKSPYGQGGGLVPLYAAGGRNSHPRGSNGGTLSYVSLRLLILAFFASFFLLYF